MGQEPKRKEGFVLEGVSGIYSESRLVIEIRDSIKNQYSETPEIICQLTGRSYNPFQNLPVRYH